VKRILVLEGPDGGGKTTLSDRFRPRFGYRHEGPPDPRFGAFDYYVARLFDAYLESVLTPGVVLDRFALGDRVYGPIFRGADRFGDDGWAKMRSVMDAAGCLRVLCLPPLEACLSAWRRRHAERREFVPDEELFALTYERWLEFRDDPGQVTYDWTRGADAEYEKVKEALTA